MEEFVRKNGYVEMWIDGEFVGNYDTVEEYHREKKNEDKQSYFLLWFIFLNAPTPPYIIIIT